MARAFGDFCLKEYGVISIPEFSHRILSDRDKFIVLASDGVCLSVFKLFHVVDFYIQLFISLLICHILEIVGICL